MMVTKCAQNVLFDPLVLKIQIFSLFPNSKNAAPKSAKIDRVGTCTCNFDTGFQHVPRSIFLKFSRYCYGTSIT